MNAESQTCRDCGAEFPYTEDADRCTDCCPATLCGLLPGGAGFCRLDAGHDGAHVLQQMPDDDDDGGITPEGQELGHRYVMGHVNAYCPECSRVHSEREGRRITVLDCDYDADK